MNVRLAFILASLLLLLPVVAPVSAEDGLPGTPADTAAKGFFALQGVQAKALSDQEMNEIRGGAITFTLTPLGDLPPSVPGVNLNLTAPATGLSDFDIRPTDFLIMCGNCFIIPG